MALSAVYIETYGCQMNKLDAETVAAVLGEAGYGIVDSPAEADVILINTCCVRERAEVRVHGRVGELMKYRRERPDLVIGIIGCMAQRLGEQLVRGPVRIVAGPDSYRRLPELIARAVGGAAVDITLDDGELYDDIRPVRTTPHTAWLAVMRGCNNFCSYCIVPYTRGRERSMSWQLVVDEAARLADDGVRELTLLGQNVNSYRDGDVDFAVLLDRIADSGVPWVRFMTSHPRDLTVDTMDVMAARETVCRHLHLPLQSGSDRMLSAMNRGYTVAKYRRLVDEVRHRIPGLALTTDLIFGFPGETDEDFRETLALMEDIGFDFAFLYRYSEREGTKALGLTDAVPENERKARLGEAIGLQKAIERKRHDELAGTLHRVLVKGASKDGTGWHGMTESAMPIVFEGGELSAGEFADVRITGTTGASLMGMIEQ
jgi:tRNA-2-methylthio-N6-dimethylallyladenosine synthase